MKICIAQQNYKIGDFDYNLGKIISAIQEAKSEKSDLIVFSELSICGYPPLDLLAQGQFITACDDAIQQLKYLAEGISILIGAPARNPKLEGKDLYNAVYFLQNKEIAGIIYKTLLPDYDIFDEYRYFEPGHDPKCITINDVKIAVTICEDIWDIVDNPLYQYSPMEVLIKESPELMINVSASPFDYTHAEDRKFIVPQNAKKYKIPVIYCNAIGAQTELVFDGGSLVADADGNIIKEMPYFQESLDYVIFENGTFQSEVEIQGRDLPKELLAPKKLDSTLNIPLIYNALVLGISEYFSKTGFTNAVISSSGGLDSAVTLALACDALGAERVHALLLPSTFSTEHSVNDATQLSLNLKNKYQLISIKPIYDVIIESLEPIFNNLPFDVTEENIQARIRGLLVMAVANKFNYILLNTSNKSELAVGYGTLYGDMAGGLSVLGDLYKTQVYELAKYINRNGTIIPEHILTKPPSAELRFEQKDADSLPPYTILDAILYQYIERSQAIDQIIKMGFDQKTVNRSILLVNRNEYKRRQFCPIIRVSPKSFGTGRFLPIVAHYPNH